MTLEMGIHWSSGAQSRKQERWRKWKKEVQEKNLRILEFYRKARPRGELFAAGESCERDHQVSLASERFGSHEALPEVCPLGMSIILPTGSEPQSPYKVLDAV